jgi:tRNA threonylcarbamoyladenosine biosynthesis protein TsaE
VALTLNSANEAETVAYGRRLAESLAPNDVVTLTGDLGAGKTCLVKGVAAGLAVPETVTSPTFNILLVHRGRVPLYHIDLYRLDRAEQLEDIDWWGVVEGDGVTAVEWGDRFPNDLPESYVDVKFHITADAERDIELAWSGPRGAELAAAWIDSVAPNAEGIRVIA